MKLKPINQQVVVIVGANSGIGRITAKRFAERGARVVAAGRALPALESLVSEIVESGGQAIAAPVEVTDFNQMTALADRAVHMFGRIDSWVNVAAVALYARFEDTRPEEFKRVIDVNLLGQVYGAMAALPHLKRTGRGALIHVTSVEAKRGVPYHSAYASSKHGVNGFLDALRLELQHDGLPISVTNVMPGSINTPFFDKAMTKIGVQPRPLPPVYEPELVADAILHAAENPTRDLPVGGSSFMLNVTQRISPKLGDAFMRRTAFKGQHTDIPKPANAPSNLWEHLPGYDKVKGSFGQETIPSPVTQARLSPVVRLVGAASLLTAGIVLAARSLRPTPRKLAIPVIGALLSKPQTRRATLRTAGKTASKTVRKTARSAARNISDKVSSRNNNGIKRVLPTS